MLLDRLLSNLEITLQPFAVCGVSPGWRMRLDRQDWITVHFVTAGSGRLRVGSERVMAMPPHSLALIPAHIRHQLETGDPVTHEVDAQARTREDQLKVYEAGPADADELLVACGRLQARYAGGPGIFDQLTTPLVLDFADSPEMVGVFERMLEEERHPSAASAAMLSALMSEAMILLFRRLCLDAECTLPWLNALDEPRLSRSLAQMVEHPEQMHTVVSLAEAADMSRSAFAQSFKASLGESPMAYLREVRMRHAASLLEHGDLTVDEVARRSGYDSRSQFTRAFSARFGRSPSEFRRQPLLLSTT